MNIKHGFYSKNTSINPDCIMLGCNSIEVKHALNTYSKLIEKVVKFEVVTAGSSDLVVRLIDCAMPNNDHLLPKEVQAECWEYYRSRTFEVLNRIGKEKTLNELIAQYEQFSH